MSFTHPGRSARRLRPAFQVGDVAALVDLYEDSAIQIQQDGATVTGRDALAGVFTRLLASGLTMQGDPQKAIVAGDLALTSTHYTFGADGPGGARTVATAEVSDVKQTATAGRHRRTCLRLNATSEMAAPPTRRRRRLAGPGGGPAERGTWPSAARNSSGCEFFGRAGFGIPAALPLSQGVRFPAILRDRGPAQKKDAGKAVAEHGRRKRERKNCNGRSSSGHQP